jgi:redox-sensitive bicupin YhaK (pirin superfamily)
MTSPTPPAPQRHAARRSIVGEDTPIARALPNRERRMVGAWCFLDHAGPLRFAPGKGMHVGAHPHIGLQTFTWMIEGEFLHRDSLGYEQIVRPGQVNLMTAGRGVAHSEDSVRDGANLHAAQLWIALPEAERQREPAFCNYADLPVLQADGFRITVLAGTVLGQTAPTRVYSPLCGVDLSCDGPARTTLPLDPAFEYGALVLRGEATLAGERLPADELLFFPAGRHELSLQADGPAEILLLGGEPFGEAIILWWNFVGRTHQDMEQALADWNAHPNTGGCFGTVRPGCLATPLKAPSLEGVHLNPGA